MYFFKLCYIHLHYPRAPTGGMHTVVEVHMVEWLIWDTVCSSRN